MKHPYTQNIGLSAYIRFTRLPLTLCMLGIFHDFLSSADFFSSKILLGTLSACQTVWVQNRPDVLSGLIWVPIVCKDNQQTKNGKELKRQPHLQPSIKYGIFVPFWTRLDILYFCLLISHNPEHAILTCKSQKIGTSEPIDYL